MNIIEIVIVVFIIIVIIRVFLLFQRNNKKKGMEEKLYNLKGFSPSQKVMGNDGKAGIAVDEEKQKICLIKQNSGKVELDVISYRDILSSEIFEDGATVTKTSRSSQAGGVLIGGLALGGVGAIIGGLSGKTTSVENVNKIDLRIIVNRTQSPTHDVNFMDIEDKKDGFFYKKTMAQARHWHGLIEVFIRQADTEDRTKERGLDQDQDQYKQTPNYSVADELVKLEELRKQGLITNKQLESQKIKLLT